MPKLQQMFDDFDAQVQCEECVPTWFFLEQENEEDEDISQTQNTPKKGSIYNNTR
jgi:hypothetical protein